jgi:Flp pilus assembly protein TadG
MKAFRLPASRGFGNAGVTSVEFAMCAALLILLLTGTISVGLLTWTQAMLQSVAVQTARCLAIGGTACASGPQYAVNLAQQQLFAGVIAAGDVNVSSAASCNGAVGQYTQVTITSSYWGGGKLAAPFGAIQVAARSCYPSHV